ncbi:MAG: apolipoprotein N-acyltransferase [Phycisphaerales bacterium]|nr:apolipoprotein N-acyltransferase [Phycisphaerales bacterium]
MKSPAPRDVVHVESPTPSSADLAAPGPLYALLIGLVHAGLLLLAFPPVSWWWMSLIAAAPLVWLASLAATRGQRRPTLSFLALMLGTIPAWAFQNSWMIDVTALGYPVLCLVLALFPAIYVSILGRAAKWMPLAVAAPMIWVGVEFFRGDLFFDGYSWFLLAQPVIDAPWLAAAGAWIGLYGVSGLCAGVATAIVLITRRRIKAGIVTLAAVGVFVGVAAGGARPGVGTSEFVAGVVQCNVPQNNKLAWKPDQQVEDFKSLADLSRRAAGNDVDVVVWPETMKPGMTLDAESLGAERSAQLIYKLANGERMASTEFADATIELSRELAPPMLIGEDAFDRFRVENDGKGIDIKYDHRYNSVFLVRAGEVSPVRYDKVRRTPFGEVMPYISAWPWLEKKLLDLAARGMSLDLSAGTSLSVFDLPMKSSQSRVARAVTPICFEVTEASLCRRMIAGEGGRRADVFVNVTNDGWFGGSRVGRVEHLQLSRWRCLENATPMVRAANTGLSAAIDASGAIIQVGVDGEAWGINKPGVLTARVRLPEPDAPATPYARGGWLLPWICLAAGLAMTLMGWKVGRRASLGRSCS